MLLVKKQPLTLQMKTEKVLIVKWEMKLVNTPKNPTKFPKAHHLDLHNLACPLQPLRELLSWYFWWG